MLKMRETLLSEGELTDYAGQLTILTDDDLVAETAAQIERAGWYAIVSPWDQRAGACYAECATVRGKPHLYQRGYNRAAGTHDVPLSSDDRGRARAPIAA